MVDDATPVAPVPPDTSSLRLPRARPPLDERSWRYRGWRVVVLCFFMALSAWGLGFYGHGVFLAELQKLHGWSSGLIASATSLYYVLGAVLVAFVGDAITRMGPRRFALTGLALLFTAAALVPAVSTPWQLYAVYALMAVGWAGTSLAAIVTILGGWFDQRRGLAISLALNGASAGSIVVTPVVAAATQRCGFQAAMLLTVAALAAVLGPMVLAWGGAPPALSSAGPAQAQAGTKAALLRSLPFWSVALPFALGIAAQVGFIVHQIAILEPAIGRVQASLAVAVTGGCALAGRVLLGLFVDRVDQRRAASVLVLGQAAALGVISQTSAPAALFAACAVFGAGVGNLITLPALIVQREFPPASFAVVTSMATAVMGLTYAVAPVLLGVLRDWTGAYGAPLASCIVMELLAAVIVLLRPRAPVASAH